jgi:hypothetical protein
VYEDIDVLDNSAVIRLLNKMMTVFNNYFRNSSSINKAEY